MIRFRTFTKRYGGALALADLDLEVTGGEVVALLGPNGSGKTTSLKAAAGLIRPTAGEVLVGEPLQPSTQASARAACSYLPQKVAFPDALTGGEVVEFYRALRALPARRVNDVLRFASLNGDAGRPVGTYSGGMLQRLGLAVAVLPDAPILLLDEPTAALDPQGLSAFYELVEQRKARGQTVLFSSHQLDDVERLADRVAVLIAGRLAGLFTHRELSDRLADRGVMRVSVEGLSPELQTRLRDLAPQAVWSPPTGELMVPGPATTRPAVLDLLRSGGAVVRSLTVEEGRLDRFYHALVERHHDDG